MYVYYPLLLLAMPEMDHSQLRPTCFACIEWRYNKCWDFFLYIPQPVPTVDQIPWSIFDLFQSQSSRESSRTCVPPLSPFGTRRGGHRRTMGGPWSLRTSILCHGISCRRPNFGAIQSTLTTDDAAEW